MKTYSNYLVGKSHISDSTLCQDRATAGKVGELYVAIVADGLGSHKHSDLGAEFLVKGIRNISNNIFNNVLDMGGAGVHNLVIKLQAGAKGLAKRVGISDYKELGSTLSFFITNGDKFIAVSIGDSPIVISYKNGNTKILCTEGEFANETIPFTSSLALKEFNYEIGDMKDVFRLFACSDGAAFSLLNTKTKEISKIISDDNYTDFKKDGDKFMQDIRDRQRDDVAIAFIQNS